MDIWKKFNKGEFYKIRGGVYENHHQVGRCPTCGLVIRGSRCWPQPEGTRRELSPEPRCTELCEEAPWWRLWPHAQGWPEEKENKELQPHFLPRVSSQWYHYTQSQAVGTKAQSMESHSTMTFLHSRIDGFVFFLSVYYSYLYIKCNSLFQYVMCDVNIFSKCHLLVLLLCHGQKLLLLMSSSWSFSSWWLSLTAIKK